LKTTPLNRHFLGSRPILIIGILFFVFGFVTWLGSVLIPYLRIACQLNSFQSYFVAFSFYISYTVMAIPSSWVLEKIGFKKGMSVGLLLMAVGAVIFIPAALTRYYFLFLVGLFFQGAGLTLLQTASNPYITILGPKESAARRISIMGICNGVAGVLAPLILGSVILQDADSLTASIALMDPMHKEMALHTLASKAILPYTIMVVCLILLSLLIHYSGLPEVDADIDEEVSTLSSHRKKSIWQFPHLLIGVFTLFLYVGVEVIAVDTIAGFAHVQGFSLSNAKFFASFTLLNMLAGYFIGITCIPRYIKQENALLFSSITGVAFAVTALLTNGTTSVVFIALLGVANALMWPSIWPLAIDGLGRFTKTGASLLIMAIGGGALLPLLYGYLADRFTAHSAYGIVIPCYIVIFYYAAYGHKIRTS
jgi:MFS transporter, FHS family, L-fucose permease